MFSFLKRNVQCLFCNIINGSVSSSIRLKVLILPYFFTVTDLLVFGTLVILNLIGGRFFKATCLKLSIYI